MAAAFSILLSPAFAQNQTMSGSMARLHANVQCAQCHNNTQPMQAPRTLLVSSATENLLPFSFPLMSMRRTITTLRITVTP